MTQAVLVQALNAGRPALYEACGYPPSPIDPMTLMSHDGGLEGRPGSGVTRPAPAVAGHSGPPGRRAPRPACPAPAAAATGRPPQPWRWPIPARSISRPSTCQSAGTRGAVRAAQQRPGPRPTGAARRLAFARSRRPPPWIRISCVVRMPSSAASCGTGHRNIAAGLVHLRRDAAVGQHQPERVHGAAMRDGRAGLGIRLADRLREAAMLQPPLRGLRQIVVLRLRRLGLALTGHGGSPRCDAPSADWLRW